MRMEITPENVDQNRPDSGSGCGSCGLRWSIYLLVSEKSVVGLDKKDGVEDCESDLITGKIIFD